MDHRRSSPWFALIPLGTAVLGAVLVNPTIAEADKSEDMPGASGAVVLEVQVDPELQRADLAKNVARAAKR